MSSAYILVDVDGVLNAFGLQGRPLPAGWETSMVHEFLPIIYRPEMGAELLALAAECDAELVWCTTWEGDANKFIAPLVGLPELPYIPLAMPKMSASVGWTKAHSISKWLDGRDRKPTVWFDDETDCGYWLGWEGLRGRVRWVRCHPGKGLRPDPELRAARRFLKEGT